MIWLVRKIVEGSLHSRLLKASGIVLTANMISGAMNFLAVILAMRHLSPEAFGILAFVLTTMQLANMLANLGLNETLMTMVSRADAADRPQEVAESVATISRIRLTVSVAMGAGAYLLAEPIATGVFGQPHLAFPVFLGILGGCGATLCQFSLMRLLAFRRYTPYAVIVLCRFSFIFLATTVLAGLGKLDLTAAITTNVASPFLAFVVSLCLVSVPVFSAKDTQFALVHRVWNLSKWVVVTNICSMFFGRLEIYLLTAFASSADLGIYSAAFKLCGSVLLLHAAVETILFPEISRRSGSPTLKRFVSRCIRGLVLLVGIGYALCLLASPLIPLVLGERYHASVTVFLIVLAARVAMIPLIPLALLLFATDRTQIGAVLSALQLAVLLVSGLILIPRYGALGAAWTHVVVSLAAVAFVRSFAWPQKGKQGSAITVIHQVVNR